MLTSTFLTLFLSPLALALPAPAELQDRCYAPAPQATSAAPATIPAYQVTSNVVLAPPTNPTTTVFAAPAPVPVTTQAVNNAGRHSPHNPHDTKICGNGQVASCCKASDDSDNGILGLGGLLGNLLGGNCNLLDINLLGTQDNSVVCGQETISCCDADGEDIDREGTCTPYSDAN